MSSGQPLLLGISGVADANRLKGHLADRGVEVVFRHNDQTCASGGCGMQVEIWANTNDMPTIREYFAAENAKRYSGLDVNPELLNQVFDADKGEAVCPACGTRFATSLSECPDCGLSFSALR